MKIAICDDDIFELQKIKSAVDQFILSKQSDQAITVNTFTNGDDLLSHMNKHGRFDLLILDIIMPGFNGIEIATEIRANHNDCKIVFLTSSPEFAVTSYKVKAFYYLLKPFLVSEINALMNMALAEMVKEKSGSVLIKEKGKLTRVQICRIRYVESVNHTIYFHLYDNEILSCYSTMNEFHDNLLSDKRLIKCHKSFIVNMDYVVSLTSKDFILDDNIHIPISRKTYQVVKNSYFNYFFGKGGQNE